MSGYGQIKKGTNNSKKELTKIIPQSVDTNKAKKPSIIKVLDTNISKIDTIVDKKDSTKSIQILRISKDSVDAPVNYNATDSGVMIMSTKEFFLYGDAKTEYKTSQLEAANIV